MTEELDRRGFLRLGAAGTAGLALAGTGGLSAFLAACGSSSKSSSSATTAAGGSATTAKANLGTLDYQLSWIKNDEFSGEYLADTRRYYIQEGFSNVNLISGGPNVQQDSVVASGKAFVGISSPDITSPAILQGADLITVGAQYQKNPFCIMSLATKPIHNPQEMIGKKIGVQSTNESAWRTFLKANNIDPSKINEVPVQFDPTPLTTGTVDGWFSFITNEPIELKLKGFSTTTFLLADYNYPEAGNAYIATTDSLKSNRAKVKAAMVGDILGWKETLTNPSEAATLAVQKGQGLTMQAELLQAYAQAVLIVTPDSQANGLFYLTPSFQSANLATLKLGGATVTASQLFDMSLLDEIYKDPAMKAVPTPVLSG